MTRLTPEELREWRETIGLSQRAAAERVGVDPRSWQKWELGERGVPRWLTRLRYVDPLLRELPEGRAPPGLPYREPPP